MIHYELNFVIDVKKNRITSEMFPLGDRNIFIESRPGSLNVRT